MRRVEVLSFRLLLKWDDRTLEIKSTIRHPETGETEMSAVISNGILQTARLAVTELLQEIAAKLHVGDLQSVGE